LSRLQVANVVFEATWANRLDYSSGNITMVSANTVVSNLLTANNVSANTYFDSSDKTYYVDPSAKSVMNKVRLSRAALDNITYVSKSGHNNMMLVANNKLFTTCGTTGTWVSSQTGRGLTATTSTYGLNNFKLVNFPGETGTLTQVGHSGYSHSYALFSTGNLYTWGTNTYGSCGLGHTNPVGFPTLANTGVSQVFDTISPSDREASYGRLFIKRTDGYIYATGYNGYGQLGVGDTTNRSSFTKVALLITNMTVWPIGTQYGHTFFELSDADGHGLYGAGYNGNGELGINGNTTNQSTPVGLTGWGTYASGRYIKKVIGCSAISVGVGTNTFGFTGILWDNGTTTEFYTSGYNGYGELGDGTLTSKSLPASPSVGTGRIKDVATTGSHGCVMLLKENGELYVWGGNFQGQLGNGTTTDNPTPALRTTGVTDIFADPAAQVQNYYQAVFYQKSTGLYAAGYNAYGQLGVGDTTDRSTFTQVKLPGDFTVSMLGSFSTSYPTTTFLAVGTDGRLYGWGHNTQSGVTSDSATNALAPIQINIPLGA
jgi:alpha-tubulin suppressor-like RCC1 family protein